MSRITSLKVQKQNRKRVSVYLDGRFAFGVPAIVAASLRLGQLLSEAEREALSERGDEEQAYEKALGYLSHRPRSRSEVVDFLRKRQVADAQIETIVDRLEHAGLLGDEAFAQFWVENREQFRPRGPVALRYELRAKGISSEAIDRALESVDVAASAYEAAGRKAHQWHAHDHSLFLRKASEFLMRRGFSYPVAREAAERLWSELAQAEQPTG